MVYDTHIHIMDDNVDPVNFSNKLKKAGIDGGVMLSQPPKCFYHHSYCFSQKPSDRLDNLMAWCGQSENLYPFFWIDPLEKNALKQVKAAVKRGVMGFKVICDHYYPYDKRALEVFSAIAENKKPILFHSGILWDGKMSSIYNRPIGFEALIEISGLKFALAHISWPWCDELIAVYGKFQHAYKARPDLSVEMFVDITPGTPQIYREEALYKLFKVGYDVKDHVLFGTDSFTNTLDVKHVGKMISSDRKIMKELELPQETIDGVFANNFKRFLGIA